MLYSFEYSGIGISNTEVEAINSFKEKYFRKLIEYCQNENITLILAKTPRCDWTVEKHNAIEEIANEYGIDFLDYNCTELYNESGFDAQMDFKDSGHLNITGALKLTNNFIGYLQSNCQLVDHRSDKQYSSEDLSLTNMVADQSDETVSTIVKV